MSARYTLSKGRLADIAKTLPEFLLDMEDAKPVSLIRGLSADLRFQPLEQPLGQPPPAGHDIDAPACQRLRFHGVERLRRPAHL
jgi:hypothetical protein